MKAKLLFYLFLFGLLSFGQIWAQNNFLTYPFRVYDEVVLRSGWYYDDYYDSEGVLHSCELHAGPGIDYDQTRLDTPTFTQGSFFILAAADGLVVENLWIGGYGNAIILRHDQASGSVYFTLYGHQENPSPIPVGQSVLRGQGEVKGPWDLLQAKKLNNLQVSGFMK